MAKVGRKPGTPKTGGRAPGTPNKATTAAREVIARFADEMAPEFVKWISAVAAKDEAKAADLYLRAIEYHIPKLARQEVTGQDGAPLGIVMIPMKK